MIAYSEPIPSDDLLSMSHASVYYFAWILRVSSHCRHWSTVDSARTRVDKKTGTRRVTRVKVQAWVS